MILTFNFNFRAGSLIALFSGFQYFGGVAFGFHMVPDLNDPSIWADQIGTAYDAHERSSHEFLHAPRAVGFDHFVLGVAQ